MIGLVVQVTPLSKLNCEPVEVTSIVPVVTKQLGCETITSGVVAIWVGSIVTEATLLQPSESVTVTEYVPIAVTVILCVVKPLFHK